MTIREKLLIKVFFIAGVWFLGNPCGWAASSSPDMALGVAHYTMGVIHELNEDIISAAQEYEQAVKADDTFFAGHFRLGEARARTGDHQGAVAALLRAGEMAPDDLRVHYDLAVSYSFLNDADRAAAEYEIVLRNLSKDDPRNAELMFFLGQLYYSAGQRDKAMEEFSRGLAIQADNVDLLSLVGDYYLKGSGREKGKGLLRRCLDVDPFYADCLNSLAYAEAEDNVNLEEARRLADRALEVEPENPAFLDTRGWVSFRQGRLVEALNDFLRADQMLKAPEILDHIAETYAGLGRPELAREYWQQALDLVPELFDVKEKLDLLEQASDRQ